MLWSNKKVLVTGAGGFIGSHLVEALVQMGAETRAFVRYQSMGSWGWLENSCYKKDIEVFAGDIRDGDTVKKATKNCDIVFHLAALIGIPYSYESPLAYVRTNVEGTAHVCQAALEGGVQLLVHTSTSEVYGTPGRVPVREGDPLNPQSPYAATKVAADQLVLSFYRSFNLPVKVARPFNTYGPRQSARAVIPSIIVQMLNGRETIRLGNLEPTRDFTYVEDTVDGLLQIAASNDLLGEVTHIGSNHEISVAGLTELLTDLLGKKVHILRDDQRVRPQASEVAQLVCDSTKICTVTGWKPKYNLRTGLMETVQWIRDHLDRYKPEFYYV